MNLQSNDIFSYKRKAEGDLRHRHREVGHMKRETETGLRLPQAGECLEPAEAGRSTKD